MRHAEESYRYGFMIVDDFDFDINTIFILQINDIILYYILWYFCIYIILSYNGIILSLLLHHKYATIVVVGGRLLIYLTMKQNILDIYYCHFYNRDKFILEILRYV